MRCIKDGWLREYLRYTDGQESPDIFHLWVGLTVLSAVIERKVVLDRGYYRLYPNLYTILVAGSAICRKSVSIGIGMSLLKDLPEPPSVFAQKITAERLIQLLSGDVEAEGTILTLNSSAILHAPELSVFLGKTAHDSGLLAVLTDLYDSPKEWSYETKGGGSQELHNVYLSMLGGTTPEWLKSSIPSEAIGGGFLSRCIMIYEDTPKKPIAFPVVGEDVGLMRERLAKDLQYIQTIAGQATISQEGKEWYTTWYGNELERVRLLNMGEMLVRRPDTLLKVALLFSIAEQDDLVIGLSHLQMAQAALDRVESTIHKAIGPLMTASPSELATKVLDVIQRNEAISHSQLVKYCWRMGDGGQISMAIDTLLQAELIKMSAVGPRGGRIYKAVSSKIENTDEEMVGDGH
jgi:hypothetical protein